MCKWNPRRTGLLHNVKHVSLQWTADYRDSDILQRDQNANGVVLASTGFAQRWDCLFRRASAERSPAYGVYRPWNVTWKTEIAANAMCATVEE